MLGHPSKLMQIFFSHAANNNYIFSDVFHRMNFAANGEFEGTLNAEGYWICLDLLKSFVTEAYTGWSTAYSAFSILLQLQSFLFQGAHTHDNFPARARSAAKEFR